MKNNIFHVYSCARSSWNSDLRWYSDRVSRFPTDSGHTIVTAEPYSHSIRGAPLFISIVYSLYLYGWSLRCSSCKQPHYLPQWPFVGAHWPRYPPLQDQKHRPLSARLSGEAAASQGQLRQPLGRLGPLVLLRSELFWVPVPRRPTLRRYA
jgi:hypothetical protein